MAVGAVDNPFKITWGSRVVGGAANDYQIDGPYAIELNFTSFRFTFDLMVVATTLATLRTLSDAIEVDFHKRDQNFTIEIDSIANSGVSKWDYVHGVDFLNSTSTVLKAANVDTDKGVARQYTVMIEAELPPNATTGLRDFEINVDFDAGRKKMVLMRGVYTAFATGVTAEAEYIARFDAVASTHLTAIDSSATWEQEDESYTYDRNNHTCSFTRQYEEILFEQSSGTTDDTDLVDHRVTFSTVASHPGDSVESLYRLRKVVAQYEVSIDIEQTTDLQAAFTNKIKPHMLAVFRATYAPQILCIEDQTVTYDETAKRVAVRMQILYQPSQADFVVEATSSVAYREQRTIDYSYPHSGDEFAATADPGWATRERVATRVVVVVGFVTPKLRLKNPPKRSGWNLLQNSSEITPTWIGDPDEEQIMITVVTDTTVERFNSLPSGGGGGGGGDDGNGFYDFAKWKWKKPPSGGGASATGRGM